MNDTPKQSWFARLTGGLKRTSSALGTAIADIVTKGPMDPAILDEIEEALIRSDLGVQAAADVTEIINRGWYKQAISPEEVKAVIADHVAKVLEPVAKPLAVGLIDFIVATMSSSATSVPVTALSSPPARTALAKVTTSFLLEAAT